MYDTADDDALREILMLIVRRAVQDSRSHQRMMRSDAILWLQSEQCREIFASMNLPYTSVEEHLKTLDNL